MLSWGKPRVDKDYYLWLAFEWRNLFLACGHCANSKGDQFPVEGERASYLASFDDVSEQERGLLVDPTAEELGRHIRFLYDGDALPLSLQGRETIDIFDLNRKELTSARAGLAAELLEALQSDDSRNTADQLRRLLTVFAPHSGALYNILKRIPSGWRSNEVPITGSGETFFRNFIQAISQADSVQRSRLRSAVQEAMETMAAQGNRFATLFL